MAGCSPDEVVTRLTAQPLTVAVVGFSPGFAYLEGLPAALRAVPRRDRPRPGRARRLGGARQRARRRVPDRVAGRLAARRADRPPPLLADRAALRRPRPGRPRAVPPWPAPTTRSRRRSRSRPPGRRPAARGVCSRCWRRGCAPWCRTAAAVASPRWGFPAAGPADPVSFALANALVGNEPGAGALELTGGGTRLRASGPATSRSSARHPRCASTARPCRAASCCRSRRARCSRCAPLRRGCRTYLAVAGGLLGPLVFGSSAATSCAASVPGPLGPGAPLRRARGRRRSATTWRRARRPSSRPARRSSCAWCPGRTPSGSGPTRWRAWPRRRVPCRAATATGWGSACAPSTAMPACASSVQGELDSQAMVTGAVQVPPDGDPVVLVARPRHARRATRCSPWSRRPTTACSASAPRDTRCASSPVGADEAEEAWQAGRRTLTGPSSATTRWTRADPPVDGLQTSSFTAVPTPMTTTTTRRRARAARGRGGPDVAPDQAAEREQPDRFPGQPAVDEEDDGGDAVDDHGEDGAHPVRVGQRDGQGQAEHGEEHDAHGGAEVAAVDRGGEHPGHQQHRPRAGMGRRPGRGPAAARAGRRTGRPPPGPARAPRRRRWPTTS